MHRFHFLALFVIVVIALIGYFNIFGNSFVYDDLSIIVENSAIKHLDLGKIYADNPGRFIGTLSFALNYAAGGLQVGGYHLVNLIIHILVSFCVYVFTLQLLEMTRGDKRDAKGWTRKGIALCTALLFVSHPIQTQAVTYISQRFSSLAALFYILTLLLYLKFRSITYSLYGRIGNRLFFLISLVTMVLALFTKENTFTLPFTILLLEIILPKTKLIFVKRVFFVAPYFFCTVLILLITRLIPVAISHPQEGIGKAAVVAQSVQISRVSYLFTQPEVIATYLRLMIVPVRQNLDYEFQLVKNISDIRFILSGVLLLGFLFFGLYQYKYDKMVFFGILFFFLALSIESSVVPLAEVIAEHRMYLPSIGLFIAFVSLFFDTFKGLTLKGIVVGLLVCVGVNTYLTFQRNKIWKSDVSLFSDVVSKSPHKPKQLANLGAALLKENKLDQAFSYFQKAEALDTQSAFIYNDMGVVYEKKGKPQKAVEYYQKALTVEPGYFRARNNIAALYYRSGMYQKAIDEYEKTLQNNPDNSEALNGAGVSLYLLGRQKEGIVYLDRALKLDPDNTDAKENYLMMKQLMKK